MESKSQSKSKAKVFKTEFLELLAGVEGVYVPSFYDVEYKVTDISNFKMEKDSYPARIKRELLKCR